MSRQGLQRGYPGQYFHRHSRPSVDCHTRSQLYRIGCRCTGFRQVGAVQGTGRRKEMVSAIRAEMRKAPKTGGGYLHGSL